MTFCGGKDVLVLKDTPKGSWCFFDEAPDFVISASTIRDNVVQIYERWKQPQGVAGTLVRHCEPEPAVHSYSQERTWVCTPYLSCLDTESAGPALCRGVVSVWIPLMLKRSLQLCCGLAWWHTRLHRFYLIHTHTHLHAHTAVCLSCWCQKERAVIQTIRSQQGCGITSQSHVKQKSVTAYRQRLCVCCPLRWKTDGELVHKERHTLSR